MYKLRLKYLYCYVDLFIRFFCYDFKQEEMKFEKLSAYMIFTYIIDFSKKQYDLPLGRY